MSFELITKKNRDMADYCNLKGKTPFDFFPDDVVMEHCSDRGLWSKQDLLERFSKGHSQKVSLLESVLDLTICKSAKVCV